MTCNWNFSSICTWICHCLNTSTAIRTRYICFFKRLKFQILLIIQSEESCSVIFSYPCSIGEIIPPPLFFPRIKIFFTFISVMEGSKRGTAMQNRPSWAGTSVPVGDFFFCPWRNFNRPWNCIVWNETEINDNRLKLNICSISSVVQVFIFLFLVHHVAQSKFNLASKWLSNKELVFLCSNLDERLLQCAGVGTAHFIFYQPTLNHVIIQNDKSRSVYCVVSQITQWKSQHLHSQLCKFS